MSYYHAYDGFSSASGVALDSARWTVISQLGTASVQHDGNSQAEMVLLGGTQSLALHTSSPFNSSNFCATTSVEVKRPTQATGGYFEVGVLAGFLDPTTWGSFYSTAPTHVLGWAFLLNTQFGTLRVRTLYGNQGTTDIFTGTVINLLGSWAVGDTKTMRIQFTNTAISDINDPGYELAQDSGPQNMIMRVFVDDQQIWQTGIGTVTSVVPGVPGLKSRGWPNGTVGGMVGIAYGSVDPAVDRPQFGSYAKVNARSGLEISPSCTPEPTLTASSLSAEVTTSSHNLNNTALYPDMFLNDTIQRFYEEKDTEAQYKITFPKFKNSRRSLSVQWSNRSTTDKDSILATCFASDGSDTVLQFDLPGEEGSEQLWVLDTNSISVIRVAPEVFTISCDLVEARKVL